MKPLAKNDLIHWFIRGVVLIFWCGGLLSYPFLLSAIEISDTPLESAVVEPPANVMFVVDNSGSMDWEFMTSEAEGLFQDCLYLFPASAYQPAPDHHYNAGPSLAPSQRRLWRSQWSGYNRVYFDPQVTYAPWPATRRYPFEQADLHQPWSDPTRSSNGQARINLSAEFFTIGHGGQKVRIINAHYFTHSDLNENGIRDPEEAIYLVAWVDEDRDGQIDLGTAAGEDRRRYYRFEDDGDNRVEDNELQPVLDEAERDRIRPAVLNTQGEFIRHQTDREALQNFANWCTYHRRRMLALKAVTADVIRGLTHSHAGLCALNSEPRMGVRPLRDQAGSQLQDNFDSLLDALYTMPTGGRTPLRSVLDRVGRYFQGQGRTGIRPNFDPDDDGGACRRHLAVVVTDGLWNGAFDRIGHADANSGPPYADAHANTLADVAAHYYNHDLAPGIEDGLLPWGCANAAHQHMITMALTFGVNGTISVPGYNSNPCLSGEGSPDLSWPMPEEQSGYENGRTPVSDSSGLLDDLLHATINGRGRRYGKDEATLLCRDLEGREPQEQSGNVSNAIALNGDQLNASTVLYRTAYDPLLWQGEVTAWGMDDNQSPFERLLWRASDQFDRPVLNWERRCVITNSSKDPSTGIPFRYDDLSTVQQAHIVDSFQPRSDALQMAQDLVGYIRGAPVNGFRPRENLLGDVVHSTPVVVGNTLFVGANDGLLHAFDTQNGQERFAYVPTQLFGHLKALSDPGYGGRHRFYVDGPLWAGEVVAERSQRRSYLVGALGGGGRGYFCLLVGARSRGSDENGHRHYQWGFHVDHLDTPAQEHQAVQVVQWVYPRLEPARDDMDNNGNGIVDEPGEMDPDIGYAFGQGYAVNANCPNPGHRSVVIFGNGYNSASGRAVLYVVDADSGDIVRKIDTGAAVDNGLSTPALIDVNRDLRIDYAFAGDLSGNLWKFDLTADDPQLWGVAYGEDRNNDHVINAADGDQPMPLFQAKGQPITGRPDIMAMAHGCNPRAEGHMVIFGTGRYLTAGDLRDTRQQSIYAVWDYGDDADNGEHLGFILDRNTGYLSSGYYLVPQTVTNDSDVDGNRIRQMSQIPVIYHTQADRTDANQQDDPVRQVGWFLDFPVAPDPFADPGERVTSRVIIRNGKAVITSIVPQQARCGSGGSSWVYSLSGCNGSLPGGDNDTHSAAKQYAGLLLKPPVIVKDPAKPHLDRMVLPGPANSIRMETLKGEPWGLAYWWQNID